MKDAEEISGVGKEEWHSGGESGLDWDVTLEQSGKCSGSCTPMEEGLMPGCQGPRMPWKWQAVSENCKR